MPRNSNFDYFVQNAKRIALTRGLKWNMRDVDGEVVPNDTWNLAVAVGSPRALKCKLNHVGADEIAHARNNELLAANGLRPRKSRRLHNDWVDLLKAIAIDWVFVQKNQPNSVHDCRLRPLRIIAACAPRVAPWQLTADHITHAITIADKINSTAVVAIETVVAQVFDRNHLSNNGPLLALAMNGRPRSQYTQNRATSATGTGDIRNFIGERKSAHKLPEERAFWELVRIVFTEHPETFTDYLRFDHCKVMIVTGFRVSESCIIPADWRRDRQYLTDQQRPFGEVGGISRAFGIRHFAQKQRGKNDNSLILSEAFQWVPTIFEAIVEEALDGVLNRTEPLRKRLRAQTETGRLFPEYAASDLVPVRNFYPRLSGDLRLIDDKLNADLVARYKDTFDPSILEQLSQTQSREANRLRKYVVNYFYQFGTRAAGECGVMFPARRADGSAWHGPVSWMEAFVRVGELEDAVKVAMPRKLPDTVPYQLSGGKALYPHELLFLAPKSSHVDQRNGNLLDVNNYFAIGTVDDSDIRSSLGRNEMNLFRRYGQTEEDRNITLTNTHSFRHLQNTELFRLGLADTIISKRFDRRSVKQSYVYDHRSLSEDLDAIDLPSKAMDILPPKAQQTFKMITAGKVSGPVVDEFKRIQKDEGDTAAFEYLAVEADGFHSTPYGYCVNSFTVDPCPKFLECFNGCHHLTKSDNPEHDKNLVAMLRALQIAERRIEDTPRGSIGRENQLAQVRLKLRNIRNALEREPGSKLFPEGQDLSGQIRTVLDGKA